MTELLVALAFLVPIPVGLAYAVWRHWSAFRPISAPWAPPKVRPGASGGGRRSGRGYAGQREPRRPRPNVGSGAVALPIPLARDSDDAEAVASQTQRGDRRWRSAG